MTVYPDMLSMTNQHNRTRTTDNDISGRRHMGYNRSYVLLYVPWVITIFGKMQLRNVFHRLCLLFSCYSNRHQCCCFLGKVCSELDVRESSRNTTSVEYESVMAFTCNSGFILAHNHDPEDMITTCLHTAQWNKEVPDCRGMFNRLIYSTISFNYQK